MAKSIQTVNSIFPPQSQVAPTNGSKKSNGLLAFLIPGAFVFGVASGMAFLNTVHQENDDFSRMKLAESQKQVAALESKMTLLSSIAMYHQHPNSSELSNMEASLSTAYKTGELVVVKRGLESTLVSIGGYEMSVPFKFDEISH